MTKIELIETIEMLEHNINCKEIHVNILEARLNKVYKYFEKEGKDIKYVNEIIKLDCERR
jgi:hypothetical protein